MQDMRLAGQSVAFVWIVPILVVPDDRLFVVDFNDSGLRVRDPSIIDRTPFYVDYQIAGCDYEGPPSKFGHFEIMTYSALKQFVEDLTGEASKSFIDSQINEEACFEALARF